MPWLVLSRHLSATLIILSYPGIIVNTFFKKFSAFYLNFIKTVVKFILNRFFGAKSDGGENDIVLWQE